MQSNGLPRVVISGIGVVSPFGAGRDCFWRNVSRGVSGTRAITQFDASSFPCRVAASVPPVSIESAAPIDGDSESDGRADPKRYSRAALFGVIAAREAWNDAGLSYGELSAGVLIGSVGGGIDVGEKQYEDFFTAGGRHVTPYAIAVGICGMVSSEISISLGLHGISHVLSCGCTSSTDAIGYAASLVRAGEYEALLTGGTDGCVRAGDALVLAEGAWMFAIEREDRALARGVRPYARIEGYGSTCDAYHRVQMAPDGTEIVRCIEMALARAHRRPQDIGYINYHGTSTQLNDAIESKC